MKYKMFTNFNNNSVKFEDQRLDEYAVENSMLKSKLQSKIDALSIMSRELDKCSMERDRCKMLVNRMSSTHKEQYKQGFLNFLSGGEMLAATREENNSLNVEIEMLRGKLEEAYGDINVLRHELKTFQDIMEDTTNIDINEMIVHELETIKKKYDLLQCDYRATLDEKEELISDRDYYKERFIKLKPQMTRSDHIATFMKDKITETNINNKSASINRADDIDVLKERVSQLQLENEMLKKNLYKVRESIVVKKSGGRISIRFNALDDATQKEVQEILYSTCDQTKCLSVTELKSLCIQLFEMLKEKSILLTHHKKSNRVLSNRICELEKTMDLWLDGEQYIPKFPSQMMIEEFCPEFLTSSQQLTYSESTSEGCILKNTVANIDEASSEKCTNSRSKVILPPELENLVQKALNELKPKTKD